MQGGAAASISSRPTTVERSGGMKSMCGLAGYWNVAARAAWIGDPGVIAAMGACLRHRGPDAFEHWADPDAGIALTHRRLAIVDLSPAGGQPMSSASGRFVIVYNGEIYNHLDLRRELDATAGGVPWRGGSDTESLLAAIEAWGIERALTRSVGMFAFALWDGHDRTLTLARDRMGEKPLYYGWYGEGEDATLLFGSEPDAMAAHPAFADEVDRGSLALLLRHNAVPAPHSIYRRARKVRPGHYLIVSADNPDAASVPYWSVIDTIRRGKANPLDVPSDEAIDAVEGTLGQAVTDQMVADVPLGALLSGGIDSSLVVALMQQRSTRPVKTFTLGFEQGFDEAPHARRVARHLGTDHSEMYVSGDEAVRVVPDLAGIYDEPIADASQIPTAIVMRMARREVTVALSGDGGDELFAGYARYRSASRAWSLASVVPGGLRRAMGNALDTLPAATWNAAGSGAAMIGARKAAGWLADDRQRGVAALSASRSIDEFYGRLRSRWPDPAALAFAAGMPPNAFGGDAPDLAGLHGIERLMALDSLTYLPEEVLVKVDRAAMASSLETRAPLLDHRLVELAWRLPMSVKQRGRRSKWLLRQLAARYIPAPLLDRPKQGFGVPLQAWLRGPLRDWAEALIDEKKLREQGYLDPAPIRRAWLAHQSGRVDLQDRLWTVLMFQAWLDARRGNVSLG